MSPANPPATSPVTAPAAASVPAAVSPPAAPLLDRIDTPADLRKLSRAQLKTLATELRQRVVDVVSQTGGHFG
ncbi:MAG: 1-deoxy-D-xylulose-5-phosphate synthase N-terminal domain-containing protein, partial [Rubrivivax sp.]